MRTDPIATPQNLVAAPAARHRSSADMLWIALFVAVTAFVLFQLSGGIDRLLRPERAPGPEQPPAAADPAQQPPAGTPSAR